MDWLADKVLVREMTTREVIGLGHLKPFLRVALDEMVNAPDPIKTGLQGTFVGYDGIKDLMVSWDDGRSLKIIDGVDKYHVVRDEELDKGFEQLRVIQEKLEAVESSRCPRCGQPFDYQRGAVSRRIDQIVICPPCGQQEAIEDFLIHGAEMGIDVNVSVSVNENKTGYDAEEAVDGEQKLKVTVKGIKDWYIVKLWQGRDIDT